MNRRTFLGSLAAGGALSAIPLAATTTGLERDADRPNFFLLFTDDLTAGDIGPYGNRLTKTDRLDAFASQGLTFDNMYTPCPMCLPSRTSLFTGLYPFRHGAHPNWSECRPGIRSLPHYLGNLGYRVILLGKRHIKPLESFPFEFHDNDLQDGGIGADLQRILAEPGDRPLCIVMAAFHAHFGWFHNRHNFDPAAVDIPPYLVDTPETRALRANYYSYVKDLDIGVGKVLDALGQSEINRNLLTIFTADHGTYWPHERQNLYDVGIRTPFIVRWPGHIKPGGRTDALAEYVDITPTLIELAGGEVESVVQQCGGEPLDGKSLRPLLLGESGEHHAAVFGIRSWDPMEAYLMRSARTRRYKYILNIDSEFAYFSMWAADLPDNQMMYQVWRSWEEKAKTDAFAAERVAAELYRPREELYDIVADPHELRNLAADPAHVAALGEMRRLLREWMEQQGDSDASPYHLDVPGEPRYIDEIFCRRRIINIKLTPLGTSGGMNDKVRVELLSPLWRAAIHYTLDGSEPTQDSPRYQGPFEMEPPTLLKARAFPDGEPTPVNEFHFKGIDYAFLYHDHLKPIYR